MTENQIEIIRRGIKELGSAKYLNVHPSCVDELLFFENELGVKVMGYPEIETNDFYVSFYKFGSIKLILRIT